MGRYLKTPGARQMSLADAVSLVERVQSAAAEGARRSLEALAAAVAVPMTGIAIRACPQLPVTIEARISDNRAQTVADSVMYRQALAAVAQSRGWSVHWYDRDSVLTDAAAVLRCVDIQAVLLAMGGSVEPPWQAAHKLAAAAAIAAHTNLKNTVVEHGPPAGQSA